MGKKRFLPAVILGLAVLAGVGWWVWDTGLDIGGVGPALTVEDSTLFRQEAVYACGDRETRYQGRVPAALHGLDMNGVLERYPESQGWTVFFDLPAELVVVQETGALCPEHAGYRHLGVHEGRVAVYEGPLGGGGQLYQVMDIPVDGLPEPFRRKLFEAAEFQAQTPEVQAELRREMEFPDAEALHAALENLDELRQD